MKRLLLSLLLLGGLPAVAGKVSVVATVADLGALAREVGGDRVQVEVLARPTQDPHFVDPKPSLVLTLSRAQLLVVNGMELEVGWLPSLLTSARNSQVQPGADGHLDASSLVPAKEVPPQRVDRSMGDIHPGGNPHYTKDPRNWPKLAAGIADKLAALDPEGASHYRARAAAFEKALAPKVEGWRQRLALFEGATVVPYHKSWIYFTDWAGLVEVAFVEPKPGLPPSSGHVARVLNVIRQRQVPLILQESWYSALTAELLARKGGATLVRVPGMVPDGQSLVAYFDDLVRKVEEALKSPKT